MEFHVDDLVWAKMKGFPSWPARIVESSSSVKAPKNKTDYEFLRFFGTADMAWIQRKHITPHTESILQDLKNKKKTKKFQQSIDELLLFLGRSGKGKKQSLRKVKEPVSDKKKLTKVVKVIKTAPNKRQILNSEKSRIKIISKKKPVAKGDNFLVSNQEDSDIPEKPDTLSDITYGFMGLSLFGRAVLLQLVRSGLKIFLWDPSIDEVMKYVKGIKEIKQANSPADLIKKCDVTLCCYESGSKELVEILNGKDNIIKGFDDAAKLGRKPGYVQLSYIDFKTSKMIYDAALGKAMYLEAPIYGSCEGIETGEAIINASGDRNLFTKCEKCFDLLASKYFFIGRDIGISSSTNMVLNTVTGTVNAAVAETMALADRLSIDLFQWDVLDFIREKFKNCNIMERVEKMDIGSTEAVIPLKHVQRNMSLGLMGADKVNQRMPMTAAANELYKRGRQLNYSDDDFSCIYKVIKH